MRSKAKMFNKEQAFEYIHGYMKKNSELGLEKEILEKGIQLALEADIQYMLGQGLLKKEDENLVVTPVGFYDDDAAYDYIVKELKKQKNLVIKDLASFVDEYMDAEERYLEETNLLGWDD